MSRNLVYVKPIVRERWHGLHNIGRSKFEGTADVIQVLHDSKTGKLATGLDTDDEARLASSLGQDLTNIPNNEFWHTFKVKLEDKTMIFDMNVPMHELQLKVLKASKFCANSQKELDRGDWPYAKYVIYDETVEVEKQAAAVQVKAQAVAVFSDLSPQRKIDILKIFGRSVDNNSDNFVYAKLYEIVENDTKEFIRVASMKPAEIKVRSMVFDLEKTGILRRKGTAYLYNDQQVGFDYDNTVEHLLDPKQQELLIKLKTDLEVRVPGSIARKVKEVLEIEEVVEDKKEVESVKKTASKK
tara:strand:+ start:4629 stop:5525 length:897 start_codon:yes stop_codon:yes gene_type:complete